MYRRYREGRPWQSWEKMVEMFWAGDSQKTPDIRVGYSRVEANGKEGMGGGKGCDGGGGG
jgi:hypothetical protein